MGFLTTLNYLELIRNIPLFDSNFGRYVRDLGEAYKEFCVDVSMYQVPWARPFLTTNTFALFKTGTGHIFLTYFKLYPMLAISSERLVQNLTAKTCEGSIDSYFISLGLFKVIMQ